VALALAPGVTVILILFGGFYINTDTIPRAIRWCSHALDAPCAVAE
jgi:hypothetical protein